MEFQEDLGKISEYNRLINLSDALCNDSIAGLRTNILFLREHH